MIRPMAARRRGDGRFFAVIVALALTAIIFGILVFGRTTVRVGPPIVVSVPPGTASSERPLANPAEHVALPDANDPATSKILALQEFAPKASVTPTWRGKVISAATKERIANATVGVYPVSEFAHDYLQDKPRASAQTNVAGEFAITIDGVIAVNMPPGIVLRAQAGGYASSASMVMWSKSRNPAGPPDQIIELAAGGSISGRLLNEAGVGIPAAKIGAIMMVRALGAQHQSEAPSAFTQSDASGNFKLEGLPADKSIRIPVSAPGYVGLVTEEIKVGTADARIVLQRATAKIHGIVVTSDGKPATLVSVMATIIQSHSNDWLRSLASRPADVSDGQGKFALDGMTAGHYYVVAMEPGTINESRAWQEVTLADGDDKEIVLALKDDYQLEGRCVDAADGKPIAGIEISNHWLSQKSADRADNANPAPRVFSDAEGKFTLNFSPNGPEGFQLFYKSDAGYISEGGEAKGPVYINTRGEATSNIKRDIRFRRGMMLLGTVYQSDGSTPAAHARISQMNQNFGSTDVTADENGAFSIPEIPNTKVTLSAATDLGTAQLSLFIPDRGQPFPPVKMIIEDYGQISGYVRDEEGKGISGISLSARIEFNAQSQGPTGSPYNPRSDTKGYYFIDKVAPTDLKIYTVIKGRDHSGAGEPDDQTIDQYVEAEPRTLTLKPGEYRKDIDFVLAKGAAFEGVVLDETNDKPVANAQVTARMSRFDKGPFTRTDAEGKFNIPGLKKDAVVAFVDVFADGYVYKDQPAGPVADGPITIKIQPAASIKLIVQQRGAPVANYEYQLMRWYEGGAGYQGNGAVRVRDSADGSALMKNVEDGKWRVEAIELSVSGERAGRIGAADFDYTSGTAAPDVHVVLDEGRKLSGQVLTEKNTPISGAVIAIKSAPTFMTNSTSVTGSPFDVEPVKSDASGHFVLAGLYPGKQSIEATFGELQMKKSLFLSIEADRDPDPVTIVMVGGSAVFGTVIGYDGAPVAAVTLSRDGMLNQLVEVKTDANGRYRFDDVDAGRLMITLEDAPHELRDVRTMQIGAGEEQQIDFDFSGMIKMRGHVSVNGKPYIGEPNLFFRGDNPDPSRNASIYIKGEAYNVRLRPGKVRIHARLSGMGGGLARVQEFDIPKEPTEQTRDFAFQFAEATVALVFPSDQDFSTGTVSFAPDGSPDPTTVTADASKASVSIPYLVPGRYKVSYRTSNGLWAGATEPLNIVVGSENIVSIDMKRAALPP
ncbi:hypothetical protein BH09SUM1_BH09SUM1_15070 [soil metagenome]